MHCFAPESIMGLMWKDHWTKNELSSKEPEEIQKEYERFCRRYKINVPCWEPIGPYPVPTKSQEPSEEQATS
jgi:hypothetical protein